MTRRLFFAFASVVLATLLVAGLGTLITTNVRARHVTEAELRTQAVDIAANLTVALDRDLVNNSNVAARRRQRLLASVRQIFQLQDLTILTMTPNGSLVGDRLPTGVSLTDFDRQQLKEFQVVSGNNGNRVFAAAPSRLPGNSVLVVVMTRQANSGLATSVRTLLFAALATLGLGIAAALVLGRRLSRPISRAGAAAKRIANGEFSTRLVEPHPSDHDELAELTRSLNAMAGELERSRVLEQQFLLSISHDLRTPLTSIRGYADAIRDGAAQPIPAASVILGEANRLERLVGDLLDLSKLRSRGFALENTEVDLVTLAIMSGERFLPDATELGLRIQTNATGVAIVSADHDRLAQISANLIENALKYAKTIVTITVSTEAPWAILMVDDDGPGIDAIDLGHVFERLYVSRALPMRRENSSGLGLAIVKELVEAMGGTVAATRNESGGARLAFRLPLTSAAPTSSSATQ